MISRAASRQLSEIYADLFVTRGKTLYGDRIYVLDYERFYDYLYERDYDAWFLNSFKYISRHRYFEESIMKIHTGESLSVGTPNWTRKQREKLGQRYLKDLAEDLLEFCEVHKFGTNTNMLVDKLKSRLELDGYIWKNKKLLFSESDVLDTEEEKGILEVLIKESNLDNQNTMLHHLQLSEEHYLNEKWDDSISNSRKFFESILQEVTAKHNMVEKSKKLPKSIYSNPKDVRGYLKDSNLIEKKEMEAIASTYGLLSGTGGHPYIAEQDQARLLRHLALTFCQFVLLRFKGFLKLKSQPA